MQKLVFFSFLNGDRQAGILNSAALASVGTAVNALSVFVRSEFHRDIFSLSNQFLREQEVFKSGIG